ncbi:MAG: hypothetical protein ACPG32_13475 [Akkermansiaceae bacterium]
MRAAASAHDIVCGVVEVIEQIAFHVACEDKVLGIDDRYNLVPQWDGYRDDAAIYHFTGGNKPWLCPETKEASLWEEYSITWEQLCDG